jgi:hypothetical protein
MGILLILFGLAAMGVLVDFAIENHLTTAPDQSFVVMSRTFQLSTPEVVLAGALLSVLAVAFVILGIGLIRGSWGRRRALKARIGELQRENTELASKVHLSSTLEGQRSEGDAPPSTGT